MGSYKGVEVGGVYPTSSFGPLLVLDIRSSVDASVCFVDTGFETTAELGQIRRGSVKDWSFSMR